MDNTGCISSDNITTTKGIRTKPWPYLTTTKGIRTKPWPYFMVYTTLESEYMQKSKHPNIVQLIPLSWIINVYIYHTNDVAFIIRNVCIINVLSNAVLSTWILKWNDPFTMLPCTSYTMHRTKYVKGIHQWPMNSPHKGTVVWKAFPCRAIVKSCSAHIVCTCFMMRTINYSVYSEDIIVYLAIDSIAWYHISITTTIYMISTCNGLIFFYTKIILDVFIDIHTRSLRYHI